MYGISHARWFVQEGCGQQPVPCTSWQSLSWYHLVALYSEVTIKIMLQDNVIIVLFGKV
jgi:hypothetical protein